MSVEPKKWGVIYNPKAGTRKVKKRWKEIKEYMDSKGVDYDYVQSEGFGSVERLAKILANNGYRTIVIVGGDGALNDAINGIMLSDAEDKENIALGMIPNGIGNDFAKYWDGVKGSLNVDMGRGHAFSIGAGYELRAPMARDRKSVV